MVPKPLRAPTRRSVEHSPPTLQARFLVDGATLVHPEFPNLSACLGRSALRVADGAFGALTRRQVATLCRRCGACLPSGSGEEQHAPKHSYRSFVRRRQRIMRKFRKNGGVGLIKTLKCAHCRALILGNVSTNQKTLP